MVSKAVPAGSLATASGEPPAAVPTRRASVLAPVRTTPKRPWGSVARENAREEIKLTAPFRGQRGDRRIDKDIKSRLMHYAERGATRLENRGLKFSDSTRPRDVFPRLP